jgi:hypothetical protein
MATQSASYAGLTAYPSIFEKTLAKRMDYRVKPGNDECLVSRTRCGILHAAPQSRDRTRHRSPLRPRLCSASLRAALRPGNNPHRFAAPI